MCRAPPEDSDVLLLRQKSENIVPKIRCAPLEDSNVLRWRKKSENIVRKMCRAHPEDSNVLLWRQKSENWGEAEVRECFENVLEKYLKFVHA
jgi:hypothetical protein